MAGRKFGLIGQRGKLNSIRVRKANAESGAIYRVDFKSNLNPAAWTPVRTQTMTGAGVTLANLVSGASNAFFRAVLVP